MKFIDLPKSNLPHSFYGDDPRFGLERYIRDMPGYAEGGPVTIIGPADGEFDPDRPPVIRPATLADFTHRCRVCKQMRRRIKAGKKVLVADFSVDASESDAEPWPADPPRQSHTAPTRPRPSNPRPPRPSVRSAARTSGQDA